MVKNRQQDKTFSSS